MISSLRGRLIVLCAGGAVLLLAGSLAFAMQRGIGGPESGSTEAGFETAADFTLPLFDGGTFRLSDHADGPVFVYFWASWCAPCREEAPLIERLWPEFQAAGYTFVGVATWDNEGDSRRFAEEFGLTFPLVSGVADATYLDYGVYGLPEAFFLRPGLQLHERFIGELSEGELRRMLAEIAGGS